MLSPLAAVYLCTCHPHQIVNFSRAETQSYLFLHTCNRDKQLFLERVTEGIGRRSGGSTKRCDQVSAAKSVNKCWEKHTDRNCPLWPGTKVIISISYFMIGGPNKEHGTNKPLPTGRIWERSKEDVTCPTTSQNPPCWNSSWLSSVCTPRNDPKSDWLARVNWESNPVTETARHVTEQFSCVLLPCCSLPGLPFPIKSLALSAHVSVDKSFLSVKQEPTLRPWKGSPFLQHMDVSHQQLQPPHIYNTNRRNFCYWVQDYSASHMTCQ